MAQAAGVSTATAARALGGYGPVSHDTRDRVVTAATELGYRRNDLARAMITGRTNTIGVVIADIENAFFAGAVRGVTDAARAGGYEVVLTNTDEDPEMELAALRVLLAKRVDGIIVAPTSREPGHLLAAQRSGCPVVLLDRRVPDLEMDTVLVDNYAATRDVVERLAAAGHRRIGMVTGGTSSGDRPRRDRPAVSTGQDRVDAYLDALRRAGARQLKRYLRTSAHTPEQACSLMSDLLRLPSPPTAVFASDSKVALGVLKAIRTAGVTMPDDISMVAFDDADWTSVVTPAISVVAQPTHALGHRAAEMLISRMRGGAEPPRLDVMATEFISRESVAAPAGPPPR
ncbi:MAG: LacI family DNA-binding transcriptional regulator [Actinomycetes bacterium]